MAFGLRLGTVTASNELKEMELLFDRLWPLPRSITGDGVRKSHDLIGEHVPLRRLEIPSGTQVFDWQVPPEWNVDQAYVIAPDGRKMLDFHVDPLQLVGYSLPFRGRLSKAELDEHLYSLPDQPNAVPYVTSYYHPTWGFCIAHHDRLQMPDGEYEVVIDSRLSDGSLTISDAVLPGESEKEVLISTYTCHPTMANNELSGPLVATFLYKRLAALPRRRLSYRFVFTAETIGAVAYLHEKGQELKRNMVAGYVATCTGGPTGLTYKRTLAGNTLSDRAAEHVLRHLPVDEAKVNRVIDFAPTGSDERQFNSPGFRLPVGSLIRTKYGTYPEYHTSLDTKEFMDLRAVQSTLATYFAVCQVLEGNAVYRNTAPYGEPRLGIRGLYPKSSIAAQNVATADALFWVLNLADGTHDLLAIAERSNLPFAQVRDAADQLEQVGLLKETSAPC